MDLTPVSYFLANERPLVDGACIYICCIFLVGYYWIVGTSTTVSYAFDTYCYFYIAVTSSALNSKGFYNVAGCVKVSIYWVETGFD